MKVLGVIFCIYMFPHAPSKTPEITPRTKLFQTPKHLVKTGFFISYSKLNRVTYYILITHPQDIL